MSYRCTSTLICESEFTLCISNNGDVYSFGRDNRGSHGHEEEHVLHPTKIEMLQNIKSISCGYQHSVCADEHGSVFTFGTNENGELGIGQEKDILPFTYQPQKVNVPLVKQAVCGGDFSFCLTENGDVYGFGDNKYGQLGIGITSSHVTSPQKLVDLANVEFLDCGGYHTICKTKDNGVYSWGYNIEGQLGTGGNDKKKSPFKVTTWPDNIIDIKCGGFHTLILTSNNEVYSCGYNNRMQLGRPCKEGITEATMRKIEGLSEIIRIECGYYYSVCINVHQDIYIFGDNRYGQLGLGDTENRDKPMKHPILSNVIDISSGGNHIFVKCLPNEIYAFGRNTYGQLGMETENENQASPIQTLQDNSDIWHSTIKSRAKSARK